MGRMRGKHGVSQVEDASDITEVERAQEWENALMAWNTPGQVGGVVMTCKMEAEDCTHIYRTSRCHSEASPLTPPQGSIAASTIPRP